MEKPFDKAIWEFLEPFSKSVESLIVSIENNVGESKERDSAILKLNSAYQDIVLASRKDQAIRDRDKPR